MANEICIFKRVEKKYMLTVRQKDRLLGYIENELLPDPYGKSTICSAYLDTPQHLIIRNSLDARSYKEKLRIRSYGTPEMDSNVFFELKKKYMGVVYKRRAVMNMSQAISFAENGIPPPLIPRACRIRPSDSPRPRPPSECPAPVPTAPPRIPVWTPRNARR